MDWIPTQHTREEGQTVTGETRELRLCLVCGFVSGGGGGRGGGGGGGGGAGGGGGGRVLCP